jgi:virginiamycin B lyase
MRLKRWLVGVGAAGAFCLLIGAEQVGKKPAAAGVATPGVQRPMASIAPSAVFTVDGAPDWMAVTEDSVWVASSPKNAVVQLDAETNKVGRTVTVGKPCSGLAYSFGSMWSPSCTDHKLVRFSPATGAIEATINAGPADSEGGIATGADSVWMVTDKKGMLSRIDRKTNQVVATIAVPAGSVACAFGGDAVWVSSPDQSVVARVDPKTNQVTDKIAVGKAPRFMTFGAGSVWTLNQGDGTISRIDAATRGVTSINAGLPGDGGEIAYGEGAVWATLFGFPITKVDPAKNTVVKQWKGKGGDSIRAAHGSVWLTFLSEKKVWRIDARQL